MQAPTPRPVRVPLFSLSFSLLMAATLWVGPVPVLRAETAAEAPVAERLPQTVPLDNPAIRYIGRFTEDRTFQWTGTQIAFSFEGESAEVDIKGKNSQNFFRVDVDGQMTQSAKVGNGTTTIRVADKLPKGKHLVQITRRTEPFVGETTFAGLRLDAGAKLLPLPPAKRTYLAIGDSITCGYGNGTTNKDEHFKPETEFGDTTYAAQTARIFGADYLCTAWSGLGVYRNRGKNDVPEKGTIPSKFDRILPGREDSPLFDPKSISPDVITINLNTNDWAIKPAPPKEEFVAVYDKFIKKLQGYWPNVKIICISGPMVGGGEAQDFVKAAAEGANSDKVSFLVLTRDWQKEGLGGDWHPSQTTHDNNAKVLAEHIAKVTGWSYKATD